MTRSGCTFLLFLPQKIRASRWIWSGRITKRWLRLPPQRGRPSLSRKRGGKEQQLNGSDNYGEFLCDAFCTSIVPIVAVGDDVAYVVSVTSVAVIGTPVAFDVEPVTVL